MRGFLLLPEHSEHSVGHEESSDDVQYFPQGPDMKVAKEAAAQAKYKADMEAENARRAVPSRLR